MSMRGSDEPGGPGYFLPEDGKLRLAKLGDYIRFLSRLAQPRSWDEEQEWVLEVRMAELATCLELLAEQADFVLEAVSWQARGETATEVPEPDAEAAPTREAADDAGGGFAFGVTLDQIDTLDRLLQTIFVLGDVMAAGHAAELADRTLPVLGQAIHDGAAAVRDILDEVEVQRLGQPSRSRGRVREEAVAYHERDGGNQSTATYRQRLPSIPGGRRRAWSMRSTRPREAVRPAIMVWSTIAARPAITVCHFDRREKSRSLASGREHGRGNAQPPRSGPGTATGSSAAGFLPSVEMTGVIRYCRDDRCHG